MCALYVSEKQRLFPCTSLSHWLLGTPAKLRKVASNFVVSDRLPCCLPARPSDRPLASRERLGYHWTDFDEV